MTLPRIATVTLNPSVDKTVEVEKVEPDRKLRCGAARREPGGGGVNVSRVLKRLGVDAPAMYLAGGAEGDALRRMLRAEGVTQLPIEIADCTRQNLTVLETSTSNQFRFVMEGPRVGAKEWDDLLGALAAIGPDIEYLVLSGSLPPDSPPDLLERVAALARARQWRLVLDVPGSAPPTADASGVFLMKPNARELAALARRNGNGNGSQEKRAHHLINEGISEVLLVSLGAEGALLVTRDDAVRMSAPAVRVESKVGAGDSMLAGVVFALARGLPLVECLRFGVAAGSAAVLTPGSELCRPADVWRLYRGMPH